MSIETGELMTIPELQEHLKVGRSTAYALIHDQQIRSYRVGKLIRVARQDAEAYLEANQYAPPVTTREK